MSDEKRRALIERLNAEQREVERQQKLAVAANVEAAKDSANYLTYLAEPSEADKDLTVYAARGIGRSHVTSKKPCQDYCMQQALPGIGHVVAVSDGVSEATRSDRGSRFACEAAIELVSEEGAQAAGDEDAFTESLCGLAFRKKLIARWLEKIRSDVEDGEYNMKAVREYAATVLVAVITDRYIVTLNVGDGQIVLFNAVEAVRLRWHSSMFAKKSAPSALYKPLCVEEGFAVQRHDRAVYSGVFLSTDGVYDQIATYDLTRRYLRQITERFQEHKEPFQPFCEFETEKDRMIDIRLNKSSDDCTVVLVTDDRGVSEEVLSQFDRLNQVCEIKETLARIDGATLYRVVKRENQKPYWAVVRQAAFAQSEAQRKTIAGLDGVHVVPEAEAVDEFITLYECPDAYLPLRGAYDVGMLRAKPDPTHLQTVLTAYQNVVRCETALRKNGYRLHDRASFFGQLAGGGLWVLPEAVAPLTPSATAAVWSVFENLLGIVQIEERSVPLFTSGFLTEGDTVTDLLDPTKPLCRLQKQDNKWWLVNCQDAPWTTQDGLTVAPDEKLQLKDGLVFGDGQARCVTFNKKEVFV